MQRYLASMVVAAAGVWLSGCAGSAATGAHVQRGLSFAQYHSYDWGPADALPATDPRFAANQVFVDHVYGAVDRTLQARGLVRATSGAPDLLIHHHASATERVEAEPEDASGSPAIRHFEAGTLVLDIVDARTQRLVWRGWVQQRADDMFRHPERIDAGIEAMLRRFPAAAPVGRTGGR